MDIGNAPIVGGIGVDSPWPRSVDSYHIRVVHLHLHRDVECLREDVRTSNRFGLIRYRQTEDDRYSTEGDPHWFGDGDIGLDRPESGAERDQDNADRNDVTRWDGFRLWGVTPPPGDSPASFAESRLGRKLRIGAKKGPRPKPRSSSRGFASPGTPVGQ